jgi:hypothetical protein
MPSTVIRCEHPSLPLGAVTFDDNEVVRHEIRSEQMVVEQVSQTGFRDVLHIGLQWFEFDMTFEVFYRATLEKLNQLFLLQSQFVLFPLLLEAPLQKHDVLWPPQPFIERYRFGRLRAQWDYSVTWKEVVTGTCPDILVS